MISKNTALFLAISFFSLWSFASTVDDCILEGVKDAGGDSLLVTLRENCERLDDASPEVPQRMIEEKNTEYNPYVITPHRQNYILPFTFMDNPNQSPYQQGIYPGHDEPMNKQEVKLQLSIKIPLTYNRLMTENDGIYFGFTLKSFWQLYNKDISSPFRETNYRPEIYYEAPIAYQPWNGTIITRIGFEHESNGRAQLLSRSWNRVYARVGFAKKEWEVFIQPWYRIPEDEKVDDGDATSPPPPRGDDNPDIEDYMGNYELGGAYSYGKIEFTGISRYNFRKGNGALEAGVSFPLWGRLKGFVQYFNGYGESMIDYNHKTQRIGVGFLLTDTM